MGRLLPPVRRRQHAAGSRVALIVGFEIGRTVEIGIDWRTGGQRAASALGYRGPEDRVVCLSALRRGLLSQRPRIDRGVLMKGGASREMEAWRSQRNDRYVMT